MTKAQSYDVLVAGGGNAALCAAMTAAEEGASVLLCEGAPKGFRGGNSRHTRNLRCAHDAPTEVLTEAYSEAEYFDDLLRVTGGATKEDLARMAIRESAKLTPWMLERGVRFQPSVAGSLSLSRTNPFFLGGGKALLNAYYRTAERLGIEVLYDTEVVHLAASNGRFTEAELVSRGFPDRVRAKSAVVAAGGFQADLDWLEDAWGPPARNFIIRGTPYNRGKLLRDLLDQGALPVGDPTQCHAVAIDARAPKFDGGIATRLDCVPFSIVVNKNAERFYDEGEDFWPKRYAIWGRLVAGQPDQIGYAIIDRRGLELFMPSIFPAIQSETMGGLARELGLDPTALEKTLAEFNGACQPGTFDPTRLDDCRTSGLAVDKTHWARPICEPPFYGYPLRTGVTFTYLGLTVDETAKVQMADGAPSENIFAAGEVMAGNILGKGYLAGIGMTIGTVFGRIAGREAARHALK